MYPIQNKNDLRYKTTHNTIRNIYKELLAQKSYLSISVTEICKLAKLNRTTFYIHYKDTHAVMEEFENEVFELIVNFIDHALQMNTPHHELSTIVSDYLQTSDGDFFDKILNGVYGSGNLYLRICDYISNTVSPIFLKSGQLTKREAELLSIYLSNAAVGMFREWHNKDYINLEEEYKFTAKLTDTIMELYGIELA